MEKKGNKLIGLFDVQAKVLIKVGELKAAGYEEEELYLVSKHDEQIDLLIDYTSVHVDTQDRDNFKGKVIAFLAGEDITKDAFNRMGLDEKETDYYFHQVESGRLLLYTHNMPAVAPQPETATSTDPQNDAALSAEGDEDKKIRRPVEHEEIAIDRRSLPAETDTGNEEQVLTPKQAYEKGDAIYIPLSEERLDIGKKKVVREEIVIGKRKVKDVKVINETVRREVADVEENGTVRKVDQP